MVLPIRPPASPPRRPPTTVPPALLKIIPPRSVPPAAPATVFGWRRTDSSTVAQRTNDTRTSIQHKPSASLWRLLCIIVLPLCTASGRRRLDQSLLTLLCHELRDKTRRCPIGIKATSRKAQGPLIASFNLSLGTFSHRRFAADSVQVLNDHNRKALAEVLRDLIWGATSVPRLLVPGHGIELHHLCARIE